jgi:ferric-dicitrate binding protein FerR (iron transport regulator)
MIEKTRSKNMRLFGRFSKFMGLAVACAAFLTAMTAQAKDNSAVARAVRGSATVSNDEGATWKKLNVGTKVNPNSLVRTAPGSIVDFFLGDNGPVLRLTEDTTMRFDKLASEGTGVEKVIETELNLKNGRILGNVKKLAAASRYEVKTPVGVAGIRGTEFDISANGDVTVVSGTVVVVYIKPDGTTYPPVTVNAGQTVRNPAPGDAQPIVIAATPEALRNSTIPPSGRGDSNLPPPTVINNVQPDTDPVREKEISKPVSPNQ